MTSGNNDSDDLPPLKLTCTSTKCEDNKHCFLPKPKRREAKKGAQTETELGGTAAASDDAKFLHPEQTGRCRQCDADLIDWDRVHRRDLSDAAYTVECLRLELFRDHYWKIDIDQAAIVHARKKGRVGMYEAVERRMRSKQMTQIVIPGTPTFDGRQTALAGNVICYAQHATATCCRKCMSVWHRIPRDREPTDEEIRYMSGLIQMYISERLPDLAEYGEPQPRRRKRA